MVNATTAFRRTGDVAAFLALQVSIVTLSALVDLNSLALVTARAISILALAHVIIRTWPVTMSAQRVTNVIHISRA
jgi:hypothetical protein